MPINMATKGNMSSLAFGTERKYSPMQEPRAGIIGNKTYRHVVPWLADTHDIPADRIHIIIVASPGSSDDTEGML